MPRYPRLFLPQLPLHIVQRGHNRQPVFRRRADFQYYLSNLFEAKRELDIRVYAFCLMTNHVHLLLAPGDIATHVSKMMRRLAGRQTRYVNKREGRTGTLWEARFNSSLIDTDEYLLSCYRYVDLNPVRAAIVAAPENYEWSSYRHHIGITTDYDIDSNSTFGALGRNRTSRAAAYKSFVASGCGNDELRLIRTAIKRNQLTGKSAFRERITKQTGQRPSDCGQGRPPGRRQQ